jgi:hypothetical protein
LLLSHRQLRHVLLLKVTAAFLFLALALSSWQGLPGEDTLGIRVRLVWRGLPFVVVLFIALPFTHLIIISHNLVRLDPTI